ncbi:c-type cytochrome [Thalassospira sp.]|uniref:c-type cytochrome n=1 Tax=Thalassospira sp. TaxID=1912094 RepID=UPI0025CE4342|nr:c-type cytochrome [Thalassospira sp.]|tara:strand:+ start:2906 stop:3346 length:441 start_codon:yes stop_codon:yes gene_type:complete
MRPTFRNIKSVALTTAAVLGTVALLNTPAQAEMDAERGKTLFAERGCVICHSVNNVGSDVATSLDASNMNVAREPFEFFARMWRGAHQMLALQQADLGYQIDFSGQDIADIFAFVQNGEIQEGFTEEDLPDHIKEIIDNGPSAAFE